jgi:hypothetical protein
MGLEQVPSGSWVWKLEADSLEHVITFTGKTKPIKIVAVET